MSSIGRGGSLDGRRVLVTGATGRIGRRLVSALLALGFEVSVLTRDADRVAKLWPESVVDCRVGDLTRPEELAGVAQGIDTLFHLASYAPGPQEPNIYQAAAHWPVTALGTRYLARHIEHSAVSRVVYFSSVKVLGRGAGAGGRPAVEGDQACPDTLYGRAKLDAERTILQLGAAGARHVAVLRLPMVYGLAEQGNVERMIEAIARGRFPPWPKWRNVRSAVHAEDVVRAALLLAASPQAAGRVYNVTDGRAYSTRWLYERIQDALGRPAPNWSVPRWMLEAAATAGSLAERATGRAMALNRSGLASLLGNAWHASDRIETELGFSPLHNLDTAIPHLVADFRRRSARAGT